MICDKNTLIFYECVAEHVSGCTDNSKRIKELYLSSIKNDEKEAEAFLATLTEVKEKLDKDLDFYLESDPAVDSKEEIILAYPGYKAIRFYRVAHELYKLGHNLIARIISEEAHAATGIDIHPGAEIDCPFFIDHGTGIVIGETTKIGKRVKMYQGVTLGALSLKCGSKMKGVKRHPTIGNDVTIYAGASILGGDVIIGDHVVIGGNVFLTESIPPYCKVTIGKPELIVQNRRKL